MSSKPPHGPSIELDHIGLAVTAHGASAPFWTALGWNLEDAKTEVVIDQKVMDILQKN